MSECCGILRWCCAVQKLDVVRQSGKATKLRKEYRDCNVCVQLTIYNTAGVLQRCCRGAAVVVWVRGVSRAHNLKKWGLRVIN